MRTEEQKRKRREYAKARRASDPAYREKCLIGEAKQRVREKADPLLRAKRLEYDRKFKAAHRDMLNKKQQEKRKNLSQEEQAAFREKDKLDEELIKEQI